MNLISFSTGKRGCEHRSTYLATFLKALFIMVVKFLLEVNGGNDFGSMRSGSL